MVSRHAAHSAGTLTTAAPAGPVVVVGDVGLDIVVEPDGPISYGTDTPARVRQRPAGAGANTAVALAAAGVEVTLVACVGADPAGHAALESLSGQGVHCEWVVAPGRHTGVVVVLLDSSGERTMLPDRGANSALTADDVQAALSRWALSHGVGPRAHLHLSGYLLLDAGSREAGLAALAEAARRGWSTSVDPQAAALIERVGAEHFVRWVRGVDLLLPNASEAAALGGVRHLLDTGAVRTAVVVTAGAAGAHWHDIDGTRYAAAAQPLPLIDSTGAGDAFNAGLLAAWLAGQGPARALAAAVAAGTRAVKAHRRQGTPPSA